MEIDVQYRIFVSYHLINFFPCSFLFDMITGNGRGKLNFSWVIKLFDILMCLFSYVGNFFHKTSWWPQAWWREAWKPKPCHNLHTWWGCSNYWHESGENLSLNGVISLVLPEIPQNSRNFTVKKMIIKSSISFLSFKIDQLAHL